MSILDISDVSYCLFAYINACHFLQRSFWGRAGGEALSFTNAQQTYEIDSKDLQLQRDVISNRTEGQDDLLYVGHSTVGEGRPRAI